MLKKDKRRIDRILIFILLFPLAAFGQKESVRVSVKDVHDGDTITVSDASKKKFKIRILGVDAPELKQKYGEKARKELKKILNLDKKNVIIRTFGFDLYNRILAQVFVGEKDVGLQLLTSGAVWFYDSRDLDADVLKQYKSAFDEAKTNRLGLFSNEKAEKPKDFRRKNRSN